MPYHSYRGQEVIPSAFAVNLRDTDYLCTIYRGIHDMLAKGLPLKALWTEIAGRVDGTCKGKGGARAGEGPTLIEAMTFRFHGQVFGDKSGYIPKDEMAFAVAADPYHRCGEDCRGGDQAGEGLIYRMKQAAWWAHT